MAAMSNASLKILYHQIEDYFFTAISRNCKYLSDDMTAYVTGLQAGNLNPLIIKRSDDLSTANLKDGISIFNNAGLPFNVVLPSDSASLIKKDLSELALREAYTTTAMYLDMQKTTPPNCVSNAYEITCTDSILNDWASPLISAFESNEHDTFLYGQRHQTALDRAKQLHHFSLYVAKQPVCSLTLSIQGETARLDDIGTQSACQGKGYATALIRYALEYAKIKKVSFCFLEASEQGVSIYKKTGFQPLFQYISFHRLD